MSRQAATALAFALSLLAFAGSAAAQVPIGTVLPVPTPNGFGGVLPTVANTPDGRFIVIYAGGTTPETIAVRYQIFDPVAQPVTPERVASTTPVVVGLDELSLAGRRLAPRTIVPDFFSRPRVAMNAAGESLIVWSGGPGGAVDIRARLLQRNGDPVGSEFLVNTVTAGHQGHPAVASTAEGWVVVWQTADFDGVRARRFARSGIPLSGEIIVNDLASGVQFQPAVAGLPGAGFVVAWTGEVAGDDSGEALVRRFDGDGDPVEPSFPANTTTDNFQGFPWVAADALGGFLVTWTGEGDKVDVFAQRFNPGGGKVGPETVVHTVTDQLQFDSSAGIDAVGRAAVAWQQQRFNSTSTVEEALFARPFASSGPPLAPDLKVTTGPSSPFFNPSLAMDAGGDITYAGTGEDGGVFVRRFTLPCVPGPSVLCLQGGRFKVEADWRTGAGAVGLGRAVALTPDTGYFYFFNPANVELVVKVLNACSFSSRFWVFAGGLTNVEVDLVVTDTLTGAVRRYLNPLNNPYQPLQDTNAFATCGAAASSEESLEAAAAEQGAAGADRIAREAARRARREAKREVARMLAKLGTASEDAGLAEREIAGSCVPSPTRLCLRSGRFAITVDWRRPDGIEGDGKGVMLTSDTGYFWFFNPANVEMLIKVLNACLVNGRYWVFAGGLTNVRVEITVTDTSTGAVKTYLNPQSTAFQPILDTAAFATCP